MESSKFHWWVNQGATECDGYVIFVCAYFSLSNLLFFGSLLFNHCLINHLVLAFSFPLPFLAWLQLNFATLLIFPDFPWGYYKPGGNAGDIFKV